jgi:two-component system phosphate regulon response regulator PhoB
MAELVLVIEDDKAIREMLCFSLRHSGFECEGVADAELGLVSLKERRPAIILLDWMLPGIDGVEFIRRVRAINTFADIPVIMLTAKGESGDMVKGLSVGADDYVNKPFSPPELIARIKALLRRCKGLDEPTSTNIKHGPLEIDIKSHRLLIDDEEVNLGPTEFRLLHFFMKNPDRAYSRGQLIDQVWGDMVYIEERTVDVHVLRLRKVLGLSGNGSLIETVRSVGYRFAKH